jgi:hypothetical protein
MPNISRRQFVAGAAAAATTPAVAVPAKASAPLSLDSEEPTCFLSYSYSACEPDGGVDCWSRLVCDIDHGRYLRRQIATGWIFHETGAAAARLQAQRLIDEAARDGASPVGEPDARRRFASPVEATHLASKLRSLVKGRPVGSRTALIALDSLGPHDEPPWADLLPAFRATYDGIIGHFHLERRGLRQWKAWLDGVFPEENGRSFFETFFLDAAAQCDAVILTSAALCESDLRCCPRASTEELVGKLMCGLGHALLTPAVRNRIVGAGEHGTVRKPRFFALSSLVLETTDDYYLNSELLLRRQADLVRGSFGDAIPNERFLLVATAAENSRSDLVDEIRRVAERSFFTTTTPAYEVEKLGDSIPSHLHMITLWPFALTKTNSVRLDG